MIFHYLNVQIMRFISVRGFLLLIIFLLNTTVPANNDNPVIIAINSTVLSSPVLTAFFASSEAVVSVLELFDSSFLLEYFLKHLSV